MWNRAIDWNTTLEASGLVSIGEDKLYLNVRGPPRAPGQPVVICEAGHESSGACWLGVQRSAAYFTRVYFYDRAGYDHSPPSSRPRTASVIASQLSELLSAAQVPGPYLLLCHSWGGILAREFFEIRQEEVLGIIFVDSISERMFEGGVPPVPEFMALVKGLDAFAVTGLRQNHKLTPEDWQAVTNSGPHNEATAEREMSHMRRSGQDLEDKQQFEKQALGSRIVVVIKGNATRDIKLLTEAGITAGNGTMEERKAVLEYLETSESVREGHQREQLSLSSRCRYVTTGNSGHNVQLSEPEVIITEIERALQELKK
ncbi:Alpha/Beta hydrolase protein [Xylariales sp. PMI_506]|nr:Alpha/Beta hydrolase protein [Xylariales sp. PMI_506]